MIRSRLGRNNIGDEGMKAFSSALSSGSPASLRTLYLDSNQIGDDGIGAVSNALVNGSMGSLVEISMTNNQISQRAGRHFAQCWRTVTSTVFTATIKCVHSCNTIWIVVASVRDARSKVRDRP